MVQRVADTDARELRLARQATFALAGAELSRLLAEARFDPRQMLESVVRLTASADDEVGLVRLWSRDQHEMTAGVAFHARNEKLLSLARVKNWGGSWGNELLAVLAWDVAERIDEVNIP
jgi:hypothetical protein